MTGLRPIFEFQFSDFVTLGMEQIVNQAAKMRFMLGGEVSVPIGKAEVCREGRDLTIVATSIMVHKALAAAEALAGAGIDIEVIYLRTISPASKAWTFPSVMG